jgi:diguanylate cyclase (GGDEF)-like protein
MDLGSWLLRDGTDRERMLDMDRRLRPVRRAAFGVLALALVASGPWIGWWTLVPLALAGVMFKLAESRIEGSERPEHGIFAAWAASELIIAVSVALTGGPTVSTMAWFAIPIVTLSARFSMRGIAAGVALTVALMLIVAFGVDAAAVIDFPPLLIGPLALVIAVAMLSTALMQSDVQHRSETVIDQLTGLLNRKALTARASELAQQSEITGEPVGLFLADLDHFKRVNDSCGHAKGDAVLTDVAYLLRKELRAFDLVYRIGGEEFLVLLPGSDLEQARELAEDLRTAVAAGSFGGGESMTMSFGVAASDRGVPFDYETVFRAADAALYEAKRRGRNRVCCGPVSGRAAVELALA